MLKTKKNPQGRHRFNGDYLLTGKLFCGYCKSPMVGFSGTGKSGKLHHYYVCQKRRLDKTCSKTNVRREKIEEAVAAAIREYILRDDVIEWLADSAMQFAKEYREQSSIGALEAQLADNKRSIKNLMKAIEQGIITETTKGRLLELEREQSKLAARLAEEDAALINFNRDDVISALSAYRDGDICDRGFQAKLFDAFLVAVYLYDDHLKIEFSVTGSKNYLNVPIDSAAIDGIEESVPVGVRINSPAVHHWGARRTPGPAIYMVGSVFVLVCPLPEK